MRDLRTTPDLLAPLAAQIDAAPRSAIAAPTPENREKPPIDPAETASGHSADPSAADPPGFYSAPDALADRQAIAADAWPQDRRPPAPAPPPADAMVEALAEAMAANPAHRITDREKAMAYFRGMARNRLAGLTVPQARGLLLSYGRHRRG